jgi:hypothetical protein
VEKGKRLASALGSAGKVAASATGAFTLSHLLQKLSVHALWAPAELRVVVEVLTTLLGTTLFLRVQARPRGKGEAGRRLTTSVLWTLGAVLLFVGYLNLRSACVISWDPAQWREGKSPADLEAAPEFVDVAGGHVYIPLELPESMEEYIERAYPASAGVGGLQAMLQREPDLLFDKLREEGSLASSATSALFLVVHLAIVACVAIAAALAGARLGPDPA